MTEVMDKEAFAAELQKLSDVCRDTAGVEISMYYRPPEGRFSEENLMFAKELGYKTIFWSFGYVDWDNNRQPAPGASYEKVMSGTHNGEVLLLHPTSATNAAILGKLIKEWKNQGYSFASLDALCGK